MKVFSIIIQIFLVQVCYSQISISNGQITFKNIEDTYPYNPIKDTTLKSSLYVANSSAKFESFANTMILPGKTYKVLKDTTNNKWLILSDSLYIKIVPETDLGLYRYETYITEGSFIYEFWEKSYSDKVKKKYGLEIWNNIIKGRVFIGWSKEQCKLSWGDPNKINRTTTKFSVTEQWVYDGGYLYFEDGKLNAIQN